MGMSLSPQTVVAGLAMICALMGCSRTNNDAPLFNASGKHPADWITQHRVAALSDQTQCFECHGSDLRGGISGVSCFTALFGGQSCHAQGPSGHAAGWRDPGLHGSAAKSQPGLYTGFSSCRTCHGADFSGGVAGVSCFSVSTATGSCHVRNGLSVGAPHSPLPWRTYPSPTHTSTVDDAAGLNAAACALCHTAGRNLRTPILTSYASGTPGCFNSTLCHGTMNHPPGWAEPKMHGATAKANLTFCQQCHADQPFGGPGSNPRFNVQLGRLTSGCETCHAPLAAHPRVLQIPAIFGTITTLNPVGTPWYLHCKIDPTNFDACTRCHGAALNGTGAAAGATGCTFCHVSGLPNTFLNCTSCHAKPPNGTTYPNVAAAHAQSSLAVQSHTSLNVADICGECHLGLGSVTLDHFNRAKAHTSSVQTGAVQFGAFTHTGGLTPAYNDATKQCTNTYCHGATVAGGTNKSPVWNDLTYLAAAGCGTCHGFPPPTSAHTGFTSSTACNSCHPHVNATNNGFVDPTKHINGAIDVTAGAASHAFPYPGSVHMSAAGAAPFSGCLTSGTGCHTNNQTVNFPYPPASGPPDCQGCHVKAAPGNGCGSCHGTSSNGGRPDGLTLTTFPNVKGQHSNNHGGFACSVCHTATAGTGQSTHGNSNFTLHNDANVVVQLPAGITFTRSGLGDGHGTCTGTCSGQGHTARTW